MKNQNKIERKKLDEKLSKIDVFSFEKPEKGWIKAVRNALGMTITQLADKVGVKHPRISKIEKDESSLSLNSLEKIADALNCKVVYALVPKTSLEKLAYNKARKKAMKILSKVTYDTALDNQAPVFGKIELEDMTQKLLNDSQARLWDEDE